MAPPTTATAQQIAAAKAKKGVATIPATPQAGGRVVSGGQAPKPPTAHPINTGRPPKAASTATSSAAPNQAAPAPRSAAAQTNRASATAGGSTTLPVHPGRPSAQTNPGAPAQRTSSPANGRASTTSAPSQSEKPRGSNEDPRDLVPPSAPQVKESKDGQFWCINQHKWQSGYMPIKRGSLFN